jgi:hypothetical protein
MQYYITFENLQFRIKSAKYYVKIFSSSKLFPKVQIKFQLNALTPTAVD